MHCIMQYGVLELSSSATARSTSSSVPPPVLKTTGFPIAATYRIRGMFLRSPDASLNAGTCSSAKKSALSKSNAVAKKITPRSAEYF